LVVASGVDVEICDELAGGGVDDSDVEVLDEQQDVGSGVGSADADVAQSAATRRVTLPVLLTVSWRTRQWVSLLRSAGSRLGAGGVGRGGVARCGSDRCGRWVL
jgi:hypothetical protein